MKGERRGKPFGVRWISGERTGVSGATHGAPRRGQARGSGTQRLCRNSKRPTTRCREPIGSGFRVPLFWKFQNGGSETMRSEAPNCAAISRYGMPSTWAMMNAVAAFCDRRPSMSLIYSKVSTTRARCSGEGSTTSGRLASVSSQARSTSWRRQRSMHNPCAMARR